MTPEFPTRASVVIIGGGIMGAATAYHLAAHGTTDVVLLEQNTLGSGSTSKAAGGIRTQFSDETNIALAARSMETFKNFRELFDQDIDLETTGYLFLLSDQESVDAFTTNVALQQSLGLNSRMLTVEQAKELSPVINTDGLLAAAFNPDDGHCTPEAAVAGFARAAKKLGVRIIQHCTVTGINVTNQTITAVNTDQGRIETTQVVCTAGAWSGLIGKLAGVELPVKPLRRHIMVSEPVDFINTRTLPFTIDFATSFYFHNEGAGLLFGCPEETDTWDFNVHQDPRWLEHLCGFIAQRAPALSDVQVHRGWAGLYEMTPDHNALIGTATQLPGFHYACGFSGHGFLQGPAVGEVMAALVRGDDPVIDVSGLSTDRFAQAELRRELNVV